MLDFVRENQVQVEEVNRGEPDKKIEGEITCQNADISGETSGKVIVHELLILKSTAKLDGDIYTSKLAIEPGAKFTGTCNMNEIPKPGLKPVISNESWSASTGVLYFGSKPKSTRIAVNLL